MKKEEFTFASRDNVTKIHAVRWLPESENIQGIIQIVHGMAEYVERYEELAEFLTGKGYLVTGEDHLGHGKSVPEGGVKGYFCEQDPATVVVRDVHRLKKMTQELYPGVPYFILGHSMGSFITRNYIYRYGTGIQGAIIMGTGMQSPLYVSFGKAVTSLVGVFHGKNVPSKFLDRVTFGSYNKKVESPRTGFDWLSKESERVDKYIADDNCGFYFTPNGFNTLCMLVSRACSMDNMKKIPKDLPLFVISGEDDPVGGYGKGVKKTYNALIEAGVEDVTLKLYPKDRHELMNETDRCDIMKDIENWVKQHLVR